MAEDFQSFLQILRNDGAASASRSVVRWRKDGKIDTTQYALMMSYLERREGNIESSVAILKQSIFEGGEIAPLSVLLAEDYIRLKEFSAVVECCNAAIKDSNERIACRFLSSALLLKSYALSKLGEFEVAETILEVLRSDITLLVDGNPETTESLLRSIRKR